MGSDKIFMFDNPVRYCSKHGNDTGGKKKNEKKIRKEKIGKFPILSIIS